MEGEGRDDCCGEWKGGQGDVGDELEFDDLFWREGEGGGSWGWRRGSESDMMVVLIIHINGSLLIGRVHFSAPGSIN